jgi:hypothetical protein
MNAFTKQDAREAAIADHPSSQRPLDEGGADRRRRRLVKGVAALAPAVLTLRSGALLAGSSICPGQVQLTATVGSGQKLENIVTQGFSDTGVGHCYVRGEDGECAPNYTKNVGAPLGILEGSDSNLRCSNTSAGDVGKNIVVITQSSVISLATFDGW